MRIKLGPYKITPELWQRIQTLPGDNDEQRVLMALDFAIEAYNDPRLAEARRRATIESELRRADDEVRALASRPREMVPADARLDLPLFETGPSVRCVFDDDGNLRPATPEEIAEQDATPKAPPLVITKIDQETKTITLEGQP